jgi:hypothetical protein
MTRVSIAQTLDRHFIPIKNADNTLRSMSIVNAAQVLRQIKKWRRSQGNSTATKVGMVIVLMCLIQELAQALTSMHRHREWQIRVPPWNISADLLMLCQLCTLGLREHSQQMRIAVPKRCR